MKWTTALIVAAGMLVASSASAQEWQRGGTIDVTFIPVGGLFFTQGKDTQEPSFGNYDVGAGIGVNVNRYVAIEGEIGGALGVTQNLQLSDITSSLRTPSMLTYSGNLVLSLPASRSVVPYVAGGVGGLTLFERAGLGIDDRETFLTSNVGGGLKWYGNGWGLRGDYRFVPTRSKDDAPEFFGGETRYGHRVYAGLMLSIR